MTARFSALGIGEEEGWHVLICPLLCVYMQPFNKRSEVAKKTPIITISSNKLKKC